MSKSNPFSIYLLKSDFNAENSLKPDHRLSGAFTGTEVPHGATLYVLDAQPHEPWWKAYFGINGMLRQNSKAALLFLPVEDRCFALTFGLVHHALMDESIEHDFGLRVALNCIDPNELKSTDTLEPGAARRQRTQMPTGADLTYFDFDRDSSIIKSITGEVAPEHKELFEHATGSSSLSVSLDVAPGGLAELCRKCLDLYLSDAFKTTFPDLQNIVPIRDLALIEGLNEKAIEAFRNSDEALYLVVPEMVEYGNAVHYVSFAGAGTSLLYPDVYLGSYVEYLASHEIQRENVTLEQLKKHGIKLTDEDGKPHKSYTIFKCLIYDTTSDNGEQTYHLMDGKWYKVENSFIERMRQKLDPIWCELTLPEFTQESEGAYNQAVAEGDPSIICLDLGNVAPDGEKQVEPCDLYCVQENLAVLYHVKRSTVSAQLSHLFNQGANSLELLTLNAEAAAKMSALVIEHAGEANPAFPLEPLHSKRFRVVFVMITHKDTALKSSNLPLFSRISLLRVLRAFDLMRVPCSYGFIRDASQPKEAVKKKRKQRATKQVPVE